MESPSIHVVSRIVALNDTSVLKKDVDWKGYFFFVACRTVQVAHSGLLMFYTDKNLDCNFLEQPCLHTEIPRKWN